MFPLHLQCRIRVCVSTMVWFILCIFGIHTRTTRQHTYATHQLYKTTYNFKCHQLAMILAVRTAWHLWKTNKNTLGTQEASQLHTNPIRAIETDCVTYRHAGTKNGLTKINDHPGVHVYTSTWWGPIGWNGNCTSDLFTSNWILNLTLHEKTINTMQAHREVQTPLISRTPLPYMAPVCDCNGHQFVTESRARMVIVRTQSQCTLTTEQTIVS